MSTESINKKGFTVVRISSEAALATPHIESFRQNGIYAYESLIPYCERTATRVHFVSDDKGGEYGQFATSAEANEKARFIAELSQEKRIQYEE